MQAHAGTGPNITGVNMAVKNNELSGWAAPKEKPDAENVGMVNVELDHRKIATRQGTAQIYIQDNQITVSHGANGLMVNERGTALINPLHIATDPSMTRINTFWVLNDEIMTTLPSTIYTPIPMLRYKRPAFADQVTDLAKRLASLGA